MKSDLSPQQGEICPKVCGWEVCPGRRKGLLATAGWLHASRRKDLVLAHKGETACKGQRRPTFRLRVRRSSR